MPYKKIVIAGLKDKDNIAKVLTVMEGKYIVFPFGIKKKASTTVWVFDGAVSERDVFNALLKAGIQIADTYEILDSVETERSAFIEHFTKK